MVTSTQRVLRAPRRRIVGLVRHIARAEGFRLAHVDVAVVSAAQIARVNRRYLGHRRATDVISFDLTGREDQGLVAQVVACADLAVREGPKHGHGPHRELLLYVAHGLLHVLGYDDTRDRAATMMRRRQEQLLSGFLADWRRRRR